MTIDWGTDLSKTHLDEASDDPSQARVELEAIVDRLNTKLSGVTLLSTGDLVLPDTLSAMQALSAGSYSNVYMRGRSSVGDGGEGHFRWDSSNLSTEVGNDEVTAGEGDGGIYVAPASDKTGASGAWVRSHPALQGASVKWYGNTNDAHQHAIDVNVSVYFPEGEYPGPFTIPSERRVQGAGSEKTTITGSGDIPLIEIQAGLCEIEDLNINNGGSGKCVSLTSSSDIGRNAFRRCRFENADNLVSFDGSGAFVDQMFEDCEFYTHFSVGLTLGSTWHMGLIRCYFKDGPTHIQSTGILQNISITESVIERATATAVDLTADDSNQFHSLHITNTWFEQNASSSGYPVSLASIGSRFYCHFMNNHLVAPSHANEFMTLSNSSGGALIVSVGGNVGALDYAGDTERVRVAYHDDGDTPLQALYLQDLVRSTIGASGNDVDLIGFDVPQDYPVRVIARSTTTSNPAVREILVARDANGDLQFDMVSVINGAGANVEPVQKTGDAVAMQNKGNSNTIGWQFIVTRF